MNTEQFFNTPIHLEDERVRIEPLEEKHFDLLLPTAMQTILCEFTMAKINTAADFRKYFDTALEEKKLQRSCPFAIFDKTKNEYCGCTRFGNVDLKNRKLEIGWTWLHPQLHGTGFNKHCKFLLLRFCFEELQLIRVELKTSSLNIRSQKAMLKIGAVKEGTLRKNFINDDGAVRDSVYFSFLDDEWPGVKENIFQEFL